MISRLLFVVNDPGFFLSHRLPIAIAMREAGFDVHVATMDGVSVEDIRSLGFTHHIIPLTRSGQNPISEFRTFFSLWVLFRKIRPNLVHLVTIKPVLYGGLAARLARVPCVVSAISGLGFLFVNNSSIKVTVVRFVVMRLYRWAMGHPNQRVIFQNNDDRKALVSAGGVSLVQTVLIRGSGVDLSFYPALKEREGLPMVVMAARLLKDKGVNEFVDAARLLHARGVKACFQLIGAPDPGNPASISVESLRVWQKEGIVECVGFQSNIAELFALAHIVVLPSYYGEGLPKVLIEAAACGRAVITTDMPGCRDAIDPGVTGLLVPVRDVEALALAIDCLIEDVSLRQSMGRAGRELAELEFSIDKIVDAHLAVYRELLGENRWQQRHKIRE